MKTANKSILTALSKEAMEGFMNETKETVATDLKRNNGPAPIFALVDLWRLQKKHKTLGSSTRW